MQTSFDLLLDYLISGMSLSINCRKPEIMFFSELDDFTKSYALLLRSDLSFEYVRHPANKSFTCVISDLHMLSKFQSKVINTQSDVVRSRYTYLNIFQKLRLNVIYRRR